MNWTETVTKIETNILDYIRQAKKEGTTGMSVDNLRQVVDTRGINLPNPNAYYRAFDEALNELLEEGVANRIQRYRKAATLIRQRLSALGLKPVLPPELQSNTITSYYLPAGLTYQTLHDRLKERGYVIYAGQGQLESKIFRVANMGALAEQDIEGFLAAFRQVLGTTAVRS